MVDVIEVSYRVVKVQQRSIRCTCGGCVETAPGPERVTPGGRYSLDFAAKVAIDKYLDHLPLARQERILRRHGLVVTSQTLWDQVNALGRRLESASQNCSRERAGHESDSTRPAGLDSMGRAAAGPGRCGV